MEFAHYDYKSRGTISAKDFALSMVASADVSHMNKFLDRVDELNDKAELKDIRITYEEFKCFAELTKKIRLLSMAMFSQGEANGLLTRADFQRAASYVCILFVLNFISSYTRANVDFFRFFELKVCGISLTKNVVDIIFHIFDSDRDGTLSSDEFLRVLQGRDTEASQPKVDGLKGLLCSWLGCTSNC